jgi:hypothetical protein
VNRAIRVLALAGLLAVWPSGQARAEWQFAPFIGFTFKGSSNLFDPNLVEEDSARGPNRSHWHFGGSVRLVGGGILGVEGLLLVVPAYFEPADTIPLQPGQPPSTPLSSSYAFATMGNVVLTTPRTWNEYGLRPYVSGGAGLLRAVHDDAQFPVRANVFGYNVGGGAVGFLTDRVGVRFDLRYFRHVPPGPEPGEFSPVPVGDRVRLHFWTGTIGVVFKY